MPVNFKSVLLFFCPRQRKSNAENQTCLSFIPSCICIIFYKYAFIGKSLPWRFVFIASASQICCFTAVSRFLCSVKFHN